MEHGRVKTISFEIPLYDDTITDFLIRWSAKTGGRYSVLQGDRAQVTATCADGHLLDLLGYFLDTRAGGARVEDLWADLRKKSKRVVKTVYLRTSDWDRACAQVESVGGSLRLTGPQDLQWVEALLRAGSGSVEALHEWLDDLRYNPDKV